MYYTDKKTDPKLSEILAVAFPNCKLRQYRVESREKVSITGTYWNSGCRNSFVAVDLESMEKIDLPHFNPPNFGGPQEDPVIDLTTQSKQVCIVEHSQSGTHEYITFYFNPSNITGFFKPDSNSLSKNEKIVLYATRSLKSSYAGIKEYRFKEANSATGITKLEWNDCVGDLIAKKYLRKNKSITPAGKNAIEDIWGFHQIED